MNHMPPPPDKDGDKLGPREETALLWRLLQAFLLAYAVTAALLAVAAEPLFDKPGWTWIFAALAVPPLGAIAWAEARLRRHRRAHED